MPETGGRRRKRKTTRKSKKKKILDRFALWRRFIKKNKGKMTRDQLVKKFHREYGYGIEGKKRRPRRTRRTRRGGGHDTETDYTTETDTESY